MRRFYFLLLTLVVTLSAIAGPVSRESAQQKAAKFVSGQKAFARGQHKMKLASAPGEYYVFNLDKNGGFVIVSGEDSTPEILGYSKYGSFDSQNIPDNMRSFLRDLREQIKAIQKGAKAAPKNTVSGGAIDPLLGAIQYNQENPYNLLCPDIPVIINGKLNYKKAVTGCVATAMAQVIRYWQYPSQTSAIPGYTLKFKNGTETYNVEVSSWDPTTLDWANMLPAYSGNESDAQKEAVATLLALCGTSVNMKYNTGASSASSSSVPDALKSYFSYDAGMKEISRLQYRASEWNQIIYDELKSKRPVLYSGQSTGGGHSFVVDGYDSNDFFHINWGWGGFQDNFFLLSVLDPGANAGIGASSSTDGYGYGQTAIIGIQPTTGTEPKPEPVKMSSNSFKATPSEYTRTSSSEDFSITIENSAWNWTGDTHTFDTAIGVFDSKDKIVKLHELYTNKTYDQTYGYNQSISFAFGAGLPDGTYTIYAISRESGTGTWLKNTYSETYFLVATITGNNLTIKTAEEAIGFAEASITATGKTEAGSMVPLTLSLSGSGIFFNREVFLLVNGSLAGGKVVEVEAGGNATATFAFIPESAGSYNVEVAYKNNDAYKTIASTTVNVSAAPEASLNIEPETVNAKDRVVSKTEVTIKLKVTNNGSTTYDNIVGVDLYKSRDDGTGYGDGVGTKKEEVVIEPGEVKYVEITFTGLVDGGNYFYYPFYYSKGSEVSNRYSTSFSVKVDNSGSEEKKFSTNDIVDIINYIMNKPTSATFNKDDYDINHDGVLNIADIVMITKTILDY